MIVTIFIDCGESTAWERARNFKVLLAGLAEPHVLNAELAVIEEDGQVGLQIAFESSERVKVHVRGK